MKHEMFVSVDQPRAGNRGSADMDLGSPESGFSARRLRAGGRWLWGRGGAVGMAPTRMTPG